MDKAINRFYLDDNGVPIDCCSKIEKSDHTNLDETVAAACFPIGKGIYQFKILPLDGTCLCILSCLLSNPRAPQ